MWTRFKFHLNCRFLLDFDVTFAMTSSTKCASSQLTPEPFTIACQRWSALVVKQLGLPRHSFHTSTIISKPQWSFTVKNAGKATKLRWTTTTTSSPITNPIKVRTRKAESFNANVENRSRKLAISLFTQTHTYPMNSSSFMYAGFVTRDIPAFLVFASTSNTSTLMWVPQNIDSRGVAKNYFFPKFDNFVEILSSGSNFEVSTLRKNVLTQSQSRLTREPCTHLRS